MASGCSIVAVVWDQLNESSPVWLLSIVMVWQHMTVKGF